MVPIFAGMLYAGSGVEPAITFLLMAPAANILTIVLTGEILSWELAGVRIMASLATAVVAGFIVSKAPWGGKVEEEHRSNSGQVAAMDLANPPLDERLWSAQWLGGYLGKQILPWLRSMFAAWAGVFPSREDL